MGDGVSDNPPNVSAKGSSPCRLVLDAPASPGAVNQVMLGLHSSSCGELDNDTQSCPAVQASGGSLDKAEHTQVFGGGLTTDMQSMEKLMERVQMLENQLNMLSAHSMPPPRPPSLASPGYPLMQSMDGTESGASTPVANTGASTTSLSADGFQLPRGEDPGSQLGKTQTQDMRRRGGQKGQHTDGNAPDGKLQSPRTPRSPRQQQQQTHIADVERSLAQSVREELRRSHRQSAVAMSLPPVTVESKRRSSINKLKNYLWLEIFGAQEFYEKEEVASKANNVVNNFIHVPFKLEECLTFGLAICVDSFLYAVTFLPLRFLLSGILAFTTYVYPRRHRDFHRNNAYDLMRGFIVVIACLVLQTLQISRVYHYIRGQATIKLYVLTAMFEILDKLMTSFGQDTLDSLYWSAKKNSDRKQLALNFVVSAAYAILHALLLFVHVVTMFVAVNSSDQALLTLLISNNFAEMKTSVFKRFETKHLFQLTCSDMVERFKLSLFLFLIGILNIVQQGAADVSAASVASDMFWVTLLIFSGEVVADCIKHAFITKYNEIDAGCYERYTEELAKEVTLYRREKNYMLDHTHVISKKVGLAQLPLAAVAVRFLAIAWAGIKLDISYVGFAMLVVLLFVIIVLIKIICGLLVAKWAVSIVNKRESQQQQQKKEE